MKLNIYNRKEIVKTYTAERGDIEFGIVEDVANAINLDHLKTGSEAEILKVALDLVIHSMGTVKEFLRDIFDGITDEEIRHTHVNEIVRVVADVVLMTVAELKKGFNVKN